MNETMMFQLTCSSCSLPICLNLCQLCSPFIEIQNFKSSVIVEEDNQRDKLTRNWCELVTISEFDVEGQ